jgi:antitoxin CptB
VSDAELVVSRDLARIRWKCRRGMREMDILMVRFLDRGYTELDNAGQQAFNRLLDAPDQDILHWLWSDSLPVDPELAQLITHMRPIVMTP